MITLDNQRAAQVSFFDGLASSVPKVCGVA